MKNPANKSGFTLIEVLVALVILAVAMIAVVRAFQTNITHSTQLQLRLKAHWVAMNLVGEMQVGLRPTPKSQESPIKTQEQFYKSWQWRAGIDGLETEGTDLRYQRIYVDVFYHKNRYAHVTGFINDDEKAHVRKI